LSLTGASGKIGVYRDEGGRWFLPVGSAPSTHIMKQSHIRYDHIVQNEQLAMRTAELVGIDVPRTIIVETGRTSAGDNLLFAAERYDRTMDGSVTEISGMPAPRRLHQEDFGQALGIPSADKYEHSGGAYMKRMFDLLAERSVSPIEDQMKLWDIIVFHYLIGNTDGHIKNLSLLYDSRLRSVRLAPAYDIISTIVYKKHSSEMAFSIGGEIEWSRIGRENFIKAAEDIGLNSRILMTRFDEMKSRFNDALSRAAEELAETGYEEVNAIAAKIRELSADK
jgi:serine/threonine-protein kinase HipA